MNDDLAGWDSWSNIPDEGEDPFSAVDDEHLLHANAGVMAMLASNQANGRRILDPAIVPDADLVERAAPGGAHFNTLTVSTPQGGPTKFLGADGAVVVSPEPFYAGLEVRSDSHPHALAMSLGEQTTDPVMQAFAAATALLQIAVEMGHDVTEMARTLSAAWGAPGLFSADRARGVGGVDAYTRLAAVADGADARVLRSWQMMSRVRAGVLPMQASDFGPGVHVNFRRVRATAENFFALSLEAEDRGLILEGAVDYFVPASSLLSARPEHFVPACLEAMQLQEIPQYAQATVVAALAKGAPAVLWPDGCEGHGSWRSATRNAGLTLGSVAFEAPKPTGGRVEALAAVATKALSAPRSLARGQGRTTPAAISAKLNVVESAGTTVAYVAWVAKLAGVIAVVRSTRRRSEQVYLIAEGARALHGDHARAMERSFTDAEMAGMHEQLPASLSSGVKKRSMVTITRFMVWEATRAKGELRHTILRGVKRVLQTARSDALAGQSTVFRALPCSDTWAPKALAPLREYWRANYGSMANAASIVSEAPMNNSVKLAWQLGAMINRFRASIMASVSVDTRTTARPHSLRVRGFSVYLKPHQPIRDLVRALDGFIAAPVIPLDAAIPPDVWLTHCTEELNAAAASALASLPRDVQEWTTVGCSVVRSLRLAATPGALASWVNSALQSMAEDLDTIMSAQDAHEIRRTTATPTPAVSAALQAAMDLAEASTAAPQVSSSTMTDAAEAAWQDITDDAWDDLEVDAIDQTSWAATTKRLFFSAKTKDEADALAAEIQARYGPVTQDDPKAARVV